MLVLRGIRGSRYLLGFLGLFLWLRASAQPIAITNPDFELDTAVATLPTGWTANDGTMFVTLGSGLSPVDPTSAYSGANFLTGNRLAPAPDATFPSSQTMSVYQNVDLSPFASTIDLGDRLVSLSFAYNNADLDDNGIVSMSFFDDAASPLGSETVFQTSSQRTPSGNWSTMSLLGMAPVGTRSMRISLLAERTGGSGTARNVSYDNLSAELLSDIPSAPQRDYVAGNLIQFADNGAWSWFQDERAIIDRERGKLLVGSISNRDGVGGQAADGWVNSTMFDLATGARTTTQFKDLESYGAGDDHNVPAYTQLPNGNYLAFYAPHNNTTNNGTNGADGGGQVERYLSYYRTYDVANDTWGAESSFDWQAVIPANTPGAGGTTYSNLFSLAAENDGAGRLYNIARVQQSPQIMYSDDQGATWNYGGQLTKQAAGAPSGSYVNGYFKYTSNGVDRIDFVATEFHPRDYNTSIYHGYIKDEKMYDSYDNEIDDNIFSTSNSFDAGGVPAATDFTQIFQAGTESDSRAWMSDVQSYADGSISILFKARASGFAGHTSGANDHRVWFSRFDPGTQQWSTHEIAKAGGQLFGGSETDYTGLGALNPSDPNTIYLSTEIDPTTDVALPHHEIYKGVTSDNGLNWNWTAITRNSSYDNLRPIIPAWNGDNTAVLWWRGSMNTSHDFDTAVVGIIDRRSERLGPVIYADATQANTTLANGAMLPLSDSTPGDGLADGLWHLRTGAGNSNSVFTADDAGAENVPTIKTSLTDVDAGKYDVFAYFWSDVNQDWQIEAGLAEDQLLLYRLRASQQAEADQFDIAPLLDLGNMSLYRAYLGRVDVGDGESIDVFINDSSGGATRRAWYDGIGYASVLPAILVGDYNSDGSVDAADYTVWRDRVGTNEILPNDPVGGTVGDAQYNLWKNNFGRILNASRIALPADSAAVPEPTAWISAASGVIVVLRVGRHWLLNQPDG